MINILKDLTNTINGINFNIIKVEGDDTSTTFKSMTDEGNIIMKATTKEPIPEFSGVFGLSNLDILKGYLGVYGSNDENTVKVVSSERNGKTVPTELKFTSKGNSSATYRLTGESGISRVLVMKQIEWDEKITTLTKEKIDEFAKFAGILRSTEKKFSVFKDGDMLAFRIGDEETSTSAAVINIMETDGSLKSSFSFPLVEFISAIKKDNVVLNFSNLGFAKVDIETDLVNYEIVFRGEE